MTCGIDIVAQEIEIAPGVRYQAWTFGGSVPGPVHPRARRRPREVHHAEPHRRAGVSDGARPSDAPFLQQLAAANLQKPLPAIIPMHHSMDFHAATVAADDKWRMILPGQSIRFEWVANYPGVYMYHCGVPPVLQHVAMGQYGIVIVSPSEGLSTPTTKQRDEYAVVQSEFYLKPGGPNGLYELDYDAALRKQPSHVRLQRARQRAHRTPADGQGRRTGAALFPERRPERSGEHARHRRDLRPRLVRRQPEERDGAACRRC